MSIGYVTPTLAMLLAAMAWGSPSAAQAPLDYSDDTYWLCKPDRDDACAVDLSTTVVASDGTLSHEPFTADPSAPIDCFYVYPTISTDRAQHSDLTPDAAELRVVEQQFARFRSVCRPYAPFYRQVTLMGLGSVGRNFGRSLSEGLGYDDVLTAFRHYLDNENEGRGFVLMGHSQGAYILTRLIAEHIDGRPEQERLVSALLLGAAPLVAPGSDRGGSFESIPLCGALSQTGCVVAFSAYRSTSPPPEDARFGIARSPGTQVACTDPVVLSGDRGPLHAYLTTDGSTILGRPRSMEWVAGAPEIETPFVSVPGLLSAECVTGERATYLEVTVHGDPSDPRIDDITGDLTPQWGLHLVDVHLAMGNLLDIVRAQSLGFQRTR